ncbi:MAG: N-acetylmuramoyl-L-alanine amidase [Aeromicrobium sp.]|uniref:peptidoglycan recognition protein family protein n=1 Tax=Aeromicrobium sp. TaxID=1871063 RepID=UPI00261E9204|nr:N-acetylmuramoyl-L-alanine amidase [Aeromicrobium sp.]MDF1705001.1 N-acetylmuramoyl-L-alanine amidase [Aeromicrobium sp.]
MLNNLADVCRTSGLPVVEVAGWRTRGRDGRFNPRGALVHHTGTGSSTSSSAVVALLVKGRPDLAGPLCQLGLDRDGTVYAIAAGRGNHAGKAKAFAGVPAGDGNELWLGIEAFNSGSEGWGLVQQLAYHRLCAALADGYGWPRARTAAHAETSVTGKWDPGYGGRVINMTAFRDAVTRVNLNPAPRPTTGRDRPMIYLAGVEAYCVYAQNGGFVAIQRGSAEFNNLVAIGTPVAWVEPKTLENLIADGRGNANSELLEAVKALTPKPVEVDVTDVEPAK